MPALDREIEMVRARLLEMLARAEAMVRQTARALADRDPHGARAVIAADEELNRLELEIDAACLRILALRQPVGAALRFVTTAMKMVTDAERIGDLAASVAAHGLVLHEETGPDSSMELSRMGTLAGDMIAAAAAAMLRGDAVAARDLARRDLELDQLNREVIGRWLAAMAADRAQASRGVRITLISKDLERIGDHVVNLGERIAFAVDGRDVRHGLGGEGA